MDVKKNTTALTSTIGANGYTANYTFDGLNQMTKVTFGSASARYSYDENGNVSGIKNGNNVYTGFNYNDANQLANLKTYGSSGNIIGDYRYTYDANGNWLSVMTGSGTLTYEYDNLNRLTKEILLDGTIIEYTYDAVGNRLTKKVTVGGNPTTTNYQYDAANQLTSVGGVNYSYDFNGNMTGDGSKTYIYDAANRLTEVKTSGGAFIATFEYDADGRRTKMVTTTATTKFYYDGDSTRVLYETDASNNIIAQYTYDSKGQLVSMTRGGATYYYHFNGHGDVVALTDSTGAVVATYDYDAYGNLLSSTGTVVNPYRYAGYRYDSETGLYYLNARYYAPQLGRFINRDDFHGFEDEPASLNKYNYAESNPVMYVDPDGNWKKIVIKAAVKTASAIGKAVWNGGKKLISKFSKAKKSVKRGFSTDTKIEKQMTQRGWTKGNIDNTINNPSRSVQTRDTRNNPVTGTKNNDPATAYYDKSGNYVVRNDRTGEIIQVSNKYDPNWKAPWGK